MARLILRFEYRELTECAIGLNPVSIGRLPDNAMVIDHPAVSGRHARVYKDGEGYVVEDLRSTNGTYVNDKPIARQTLADGDVIGIAKHTVVFTLHGGEPADDRTRETRALVDSGAAPKTAIPTAQGRIGKITVRSGDTGQSEYVLSAVTTMIGKADTAQIRLKGWFKPQNAAAIARKGAGFTIAPMDATVTVNGARISARRDLASGDVIEVGGVTLEFTLN